VQHIVNHIYAQVARWAYLEMDSTQAVSNTSHTESRSAPP